MTISEVFPVLGLCIRAGSLELRGLTDEHLVLLGELAQRGVHAADRMPFNSPWTAAPIDELPRRLAQFHWGLRSGFGPDRWSIDLGAWVGGELVGTQGISATGFGITRSAETGSWLGISHHGKGIGTRMRQAICAFGFDHLGAAQLTSGAFCDNPASIAVSRKLGYVDNGHSVKNRCDQPADHLAFLLKPDAFVRGEPITVEGLEPVQRLMGADVSFDQRARDAGPCR